MTLADTTHVRCYLPHSRPPASAAVAAAAAAAGEVGVAAGNYGLHPHAAPVDLPPAVAAASDASAVLTAAADAAAAAAVACRLHT